MLLFASYHYSERTWVTDWWRKTPDKSFLSTSVFVAFLLSYSLTLRQLRSYSLTWGSCSYSVTSNNRKRLLKIAQCEPGLTRHLIWPTLGSGSISVCLNMGGGGGGMGGYETWGSPYSYSFVWSVLETGQWIALAVVKHIYIRRRPRSHLTRHLIWPTLGSGSISVCLNMGGGGYGGV